jgi:alkanesulfonate monooxygenase SsuD/methylene tetrahydromethanopterin reductase-like flavin-dependent oxidoreductase (luciferase family)
MSQSQEAKKQLIINAFVESCSGHQSPGLWRHPDDKSWDFNNINHWVKLAQLLEKGKFHGIFIADVLVSYSHCITYQITYTLRDHMMSTKDLAIQTLPSFQAPSGL